MPEWPVSYSPGNRLKTTAVWHSQGGGVGRQLQLLLTWGSHSAGGFSHGQFGTGSDWYGPSWASKLPEWVVLLRPQVVNEGRGAGQVKSHR